MPCRSRSTISSGVRGWPCEMRGWLPENVISRLQAGDVRVVLDLANAAPVDRGTFQLRTDQVVSPVGAEAIWVEPHEVTLTLADF